MTNEARKTPFYQVSISDSSGKNFVPLPYFVHRLIEKIEIKEIFGTGWCTPGQFTVYFVEGSREPYPTNKQVNTAVGYPIDGSGSGSLTNNIGMLADLRYIKNGGEESITSLSPSATGLILDNLQDAADAGSVVAGALLAAASSNSSKLITIDGGVPPNKPAKYLFQQRNRMKIVWGYVEDLENRRSVEGLIAGLDFEFPENDQPKLKVISVEPSLHFDQVSGMFGASFFNSSVKGVTKFGDTIQTFENMTVKELIEEFCSKAGMAEPMVSDIFDEIQLDKYAYNIIPAGMSPNQFFGELSKKYDAYFKVMIDPSSSKETLVFLNKKEYNAKVLSSNLSLLTYRNPGSIIKSVTLKAEYTALTGSAKSFVNEKGETTTVGTKSPVQVGIVDADSQYTDSDPTGNNPVKSAKGSNSALKTPYSVGSHEYTPEGNDVDTVKRQTEAKANCAIENTIMINLTTIGYAKLRPGPWFVGGLGKRYSATYYFKEVTHVLDPSGYVCTMMGSNNSDLGDTGKSSDGSAKTQKPNQQVSTGLVSSVSSFLDSATGSSASDSFNKSQEGQ